MWQQQRRTPSYAPSQPPGINGLTCPLRSIRSRIVRRVRRTSRTAVVLIDLLNGQAAYLLRLVRQTSKAGPGAHARTRRHRAGRTVDDIIQSGNHDPGTALGADA